MPYNDPITNVMARSIAADTRLKACTRKGESNMCSLKIQSRNGCAQPEATISTQQKCRLASDNPPIKPTRRHFINGSNELTRSFRTKSDSVQGWEHASEGNCTPVFGSHRAQDPRKNLENSGKPMFYSLNYAGSRRLVTNPSVAAPLKGTSN